MPDTTPLLVVDELRVALGSGRNRTEILHGISFDLSPGDTLGIVGESGSGKSTLAKTIVGIHRATTGRIEFAGSSTTDTRGRHFPQLRRRMQLIPQDPYSSLNPRRTIGQILAEAIDPRTVNVKRHRARISELLQMVNLDPEAAARRPRDFSGGQRQRIAIARALAVEPQLIIADEVTSALDIPTQAGILELLRDLKERLGLTMIFVSHNLAVVQQVSEHVLVLFHGEIAEQGSADAVFSTPSTDYTRALLASVPGSPGFSIE